MPQLYTLKGEPLSWEELHRRVDEYYERYERDGSPRHIPPPYRGARCLAGAHEHCHGLKGVCNCTCHEEVS